MARRLTIGELSRRTGVRVKTIRFYSDEGLLPPVERSASGYRLYDEGHVARIDLIRTLREAGVGLEAIGRVLRRDMALEDVLRLRLGAIEAHMASLARVAAALRAALRAGASSSPTWTTQDEDLRRLSMVTKLSNEERRKLIERFYEKVMGDKPIGKDWLRQMVEASTPDLPDDATPAQLDAWVELAMMLEDASFVEAMRAQASDFWSKDVDVAAVRAVQAASQQAASDAVARGVSPTSEEGQRIVETFFAQMAKVGGDEDEEAMIARMRAQYDVRAERYWQLVGVMRGTKPDARSAAWHWLGAATRHRLGMA